MSEVAETTESESINSLEPLCRRARPFPGPSQPEGPLPAVSLRSTETSLLDVDEVESASSDEALHSVSAGFFSSLIEESEVYAVVVQIAGGPWPPVPGSRPSPAQAKQAVRAPAVPST